MNGTDDLTATILVDEPRPGVGRITINRPEKLNSLNSRVEVEVLAAARDFDRDRTVRAVVIAGSDRAFAAGADISEMAELNFEAIEGRPIFDGWDQLAGLSVPLIAAVSGYALGGGCELAMLCDLIVADESAQFGQPEVKLGILPGFGGTQRLTRAVGKAVAMDMCLTGRMLSASEALAAGLVSRVVSAGRWMEEALDVAATIAAMSRTASEAVKQSVSRSFEVSLAEGLRYERMQFKSRFATPDQVEGMQAFLERRSARFSDR